MTLEEAGQAYVFLVCMCVGWLCLERGKKPKKQMEILKRDQQQTPRRKRFFASRWDYPIILIECVFLYLSRTSEHPCPENFGDTKDVRDAFQVTPRYLHSNGECTSCGYISYWETGIPARDCTSLIFIVGLESILQVKQRYPRDLKVECTKFMLGHSSKQWHSCQHLTLS